MKTSEIKEVVAKAIIKHAGLSDWDVGPVYEEVNAIFRALKRKGLKIVKE